MSSNLMWRPVDTRAECLPTRIAKMKTLNDTLLANLYAERQLAIQSGNALRLAMINAQIEKLKKEMEDAKT